MGHCVQDKGRMQSSFVSATSRNPKSCIFLVLRNGQGSKYIAITTVSRNLSATRLWLLLEVELAHMISLETSKVFVKRFTRLQTFKFQNRTITLISGSVLKLKLYLRMERLSSKMVHLFILMLFFIVPGFLLLEYLKSLSYFMLMELQSKWISQVLSGKVSIPSRELMLDDVKEYYRHLEEFGTPKHHTHTLEIIKFEYLNWIATRVGLPPPDERLKQIYREN